MWILSTPTKPKTAELGGSSHCTNDISNLDQEVSSNENHILDAQMLQTFRIVPVSILAAADDTTHGSTP